MLEKTPKTFNARFEKEVMWAIANLISHKYGRDKTEAVGRAILEAEERLNGEPRSAAGSESVKPAAVVSDAPFHPLCKHCGQPFGAFNRFASLCPGCKAERHIGEPRDCPECTAGQSI